MSYNFDGKIVNQCPIIINYTTAKTKCGKCGKIIDAPVRDFVTIGVKAYLTFNYIQTSSYIYETKSGRSVAYCSDYCRKKHNHRFQK